MQCCSKQSVSKFKFKLTSPLPQPVDLQLVTHHLPLPLPILASLFASHLVLLSPPSTAPHSKPPLSLLDSFTLPLPLVRSAETYLLPLIGSLREPKRSTNAWPLAELPASLPGAGGEGAGGGGLFGAGLRRRLAAASGGGGGAGATPAARPAMPVVVPAVATTGATEGGASVVSQWVDELTARGTAPRAPTEDEVRV